MKSLSLFAMVILFSSTVHANLCIAPTGDYTFVVDGKKFRVNSDKPVRISPIKYNKNMKIVIKDQDGVALESFHLQMQKNQQTCIVRNTLYKTWMVRPMSKDCRC